MSQQTGQGTSYKDTLNLPQTSFKMKAGAATREPEIEAYWEAHRVYETAQASRDKARKFVLHDGPPYLSSDKIHIGTALNKILKDIVTRYKYQRGYYSPYVPGYDGHGLPIENAVVKSIKGGREAVSPAKLRELCREFGLKNLKGQEANFRRLGVWGNWEHPYVTIDGAFEAQQIVLFFDMYKKGYVYKGLKPVYWCPSCETALADAEVEYADHTSHSIYVKFPVINESIPSQFLSGPESEDTQKRKEALKDASFVIWTTTPWTLPANLALSINGEELYSVYQRPNGEKLVIADYEVAGIGLTPLPDVLGEELQKIYGGWQGKHLSGIETRHPFIEDRVSPVLLGSHVTLDAGTGVVHTAPGHGHEDYMICQEYNRRPEFKDKPFPVLSPLNNKGVFTAEAGPRLEGVRYDKGNEVVLEILTEKNALLSGGPLFSYDDPKKGYGKGSWGITHSYPHCWRCHNPVIYRATDQWFISMENNDFRKHALEAIKTVKWIPERGESRITSMVEGRSDWCISRQRVWGVPIPVFYYEDTGEVLFETLPESVSDAIIQHVHDLFKTHTSDIWWAKDADELLSGLPEDIKKAIGLGQRPITKEMDIMDVWFDSGVTHTTVVEARKDELGGLPVELYLEGSDQHRGWFQSALLTSVMLRDKAPYQSVLTHGFVLDEKGRKMSKSLGNVVDPNSIITQYGADVLRLWVASVDYSVDVRIGNEIVGQLVEVYKKIRNTMRYLIGNLHDFNPATDAMPYEQLSDLDKYTLHRLQEVVGTLTESFDRYEFHRYYQVLQNFCVVELSSLYFDVAKDILYCDPVNGPRRRAMQTVLHELLSTLLPMLVPVMPHMAEDIWQNLPDAQKPAYGFEAPPVSVVLAPWPSQEALKEKYKDEELAFKVKELIEFRKVVNVILEDARAKGNIGSSLEARVQIDNKIGGGMGSRYFIFQGLNSENLASIFLSSQVEFVDQASENAFELKGIYHGKLRNEGATVPWDVIYAAPAKGQKCERCWRYQESVGTIPAHPTICGRCHEAVLTLEKAGAPSA